MRYLIVSTFVLATYSSVLGGEFPNPDANAAVADAARELNGKFAALSKSLDHPPEKLDTGHWTSVEQAAKEVQLRVSKLRAMREKLLTAVDEIGESGATVRSRLAALEQKFRGLADSTKAELASENAEPLPEGLIAAIQREGKLYGDAADVCSDAGKRFGALVSSYRRRVDVIRRAGSMLDRMESASTGFIELAALGKHLASAEETLIVFSEQVNQVLDEMQKVNDLTKTAVALTAERAASSQAGQQADPRVKRPPESRPASAFDASYFRRP